MEAQVGGGIIWSQSWCQGRGVGGSSVVSGEGGDLTGAQGARWSLPSPLGGGCGRLTWSLLPSCDCHWAPGPLDPEHIFWARVLIVIRAEGLFGNQQMNCLGSKAVSTMPATGSCGSGSEEDSGCVLKMLEITEGMCPAL